MINFGLVLLKQTIGLIKALPVCYWEQVHIRTDSYIAHFTYTFMRMLHHYLFILWLPILRFDMWIELIQIANQF